MFWLLVFIAVGLTLAYRGAPLTTATGVTGITVLLYGWLGESLANFAVLLLGWMAIFIPLNVLAIRQEWLTLPLLARFLEADKPGPDSAAPGPGAALIGGMGLLPTVTSPQPPAHADARREALAAALAHRLRQPLSLPQPTTAQARIAEGLTIGAAMQAIDLRLLAGRTTELPAREAWLLARFTAALTGSAAAPCALEPESERSAPAATLFATAHPHYPLLWAAAQEEHAARRVTRFDEAAWRWLGHALRNGARALVGALSFSALNPADGPEELRPLLRRLHRAQSRMAFAVDVLLGLPLLKVKAPGLAARLVPALESLQAATAVLAWNAAGTQPLLALPLVVNAVERSLARFEDALWAALRELPSGILHLVVSLICLPLGRRARTPSVAGEQTAARVLLREPAVRSRLIAGLLGNVPHADTLQILEARVVVLAHLEAAINRLGNARFEPEPNSMQERIEAGVRRGIVNAAEAEQLTEAARFAETLRQAAQDAAMEARQPYAQPGAGEQN